MWSVVEGRKAFTHSTEGYVSVRSWTLRRSAQCTSTSATEAAKRSCGRRPSRRVFLEGLAAGVREDPGVVCRRCQGRVSSSFAPALFPTSERSRVEGAPVRRKVLSVKREGLSGAGVATVRRTGELCTDKQREPGLTDECSSTKRVSLKCSPMQEQRLEGGQLERLGLREELRSSYSKHFPHW